MGDGLVDWRVGSEREPNVVETIEMNHPIDFTLAESLVNDEPLWDLNAAECMLHASRIHEPCCRI